MAQPADIGKFPQFRGLLLHFSLTHGHHTFLARFDHHALHMAETEEQWRELINHLPDNARLIWRALNDMDDATAIWFFQVEPSGCWRILDYYEASGEGLAHYAQVLAAKARPAETAESTAPNLPDGTIAGRGFVYGSHIAPHALCAGHRPHICLTL